MKKSILILLIIFIFSPQVFCQEVGKIVSTQGRVDIFKDGCQSAVPAREDELVSVGDSIRTKSGSKAQVIFRDKSVLKLAQNSKVSIKDYQLDDKERRRSAVIELSRGKARAIIEKTPSGADFVIVTPNAQGTVKGSDVTAFYQAGNSGMFVSEGKLSVINIAHPKDSIIVPKGNACVIPMGELPRGPRPYLDVEKKLNDEDTYVPVSISRTGKVSVIKGAIAKVSGMVKITPKGSTEAHKANINDILEEGDRIETGENGYIEIRLDNNNCLNLKPNTKLTIIRLVINPQTGEFENIFEVTMGKIKARIENLKGNSKFEVKTPQAVCGARGTIMYVDVLPNITTSFFEGGNGYIENGLSGKREDIGAGENASANDSGGVSNPTYTSENERQSYGEGWDPGSGTEGYSSPEGNASTGAFDSDTGANTVGNAGGTDTADPVGGTTASTPPANVPFTETNPSTSGTNTGTTYVFPCFDTTDNSVAIDDLTSLWGGSETPATVGGRYSNPNNYTLWKNNFEKTTSDGARIIGSSGGRVVNNISEGLFVAIYIKPDGEGGYKAGYIKLAPSEGTLNGIFDPATGTFLAPDQNVMAYYNDPTNISPEWLYWGSEYLNEEPITGDMEGDLLGSMSGSSLNLKESGGYQYLWSTWKITAHGTYSAPLDSDWNVVTGGLDEYSDGDFSYWLVNINGTEFADGKLRGNITGKSLTYNSAGFLHHMTLDDISGEMIGTYNGGTWQALGAGTVDETPLQFAGETTHENGVVYALFGGTSSLWSDSPQTTFIGDFNSQQVPSYNIWRSHLLGKTADAAIYGMAGGTNVNNIFKGLLYALYIRPDPDNPGQYLAGYLKSTNIAGDIYPDIDMFYAEGNLAATQMGQTAVSVNQLLSYMNNDGWNDHNQPVYRDAFSGNIGGDITGTFDGESIGINYSLTDQMWSIWRAESRGTYQAQPQGAWHAVFGSPDAESGGDTGYFIGHINGPAWSGNEFSGNLTGRDIWYSPDHFEVSSMGSTTGETIGTYANGAWSATNFGVSDELSLTFGGETTHESGIDYALFGGTESLWDENSPDILFIGDYSTQETPSGSLWKFHTIGKTDDGGSIYGMAGGTNSNNILKGLMYALYVKPDPESPTGYSAGYINATDITGDFYPDIGMFEADGTATAYSMGQTTVTPDQLYDGSEYISQHNLSGLDDHGGFDTDDNDTDIYANQGAGTMLNIAGENWGIWNLVTGGTYQGQTSDTWDVYDLTGMTTPEDDQEVGGSWLGGIKGTKWSGEKIDGELNAIWIQLHKDGTLSGRTLSGPLMGYYIEEDELSGNGTWKAASAGEWVEVDSLLDPANLTNDIIALGPLFTSIPITEAYSSVMNLTTPVGGIETLTMNTHLYNMYGGGDGIWAAIINGTYSTAPTANWTVTVANDADNATLSGAAWSAGQWAADVSGTVGGNAINGQAAGTYGDGEFQGAGTGTFEQ